jgi:hypothetical protein
MTHGKLSTKKKTRTGRVFLMCGFLAEHTQQGVKAVVMIPIDRKQAQPTPAGQRSGCGL